MLPFILLLIAAILGSGQLVGRWGRYKLIYIIGSILALISAALMG
jgi:hypothetical protein